MTVFYEKITVNGSKEEMNKFYSLLNSKDSSGFEMNKFVPIPKELIELEDSNTFGCSVVNETMDKGGDLTVEEWMDINWGSGNEIDHVVELKSEPDEYRVMFSSNSPHISFVIHLFMLFPELKIKHDYVSSELNVSITLEFENKEAYETKHVPSLVFLTKLSDDKYKLVDFESNNYEYCLDIFGDNIEESLNDNGFNSENVVNWDHRFSLDDLNEH